MNFYDRFLTRRALRFANQIRATHGLPPATRMERGMLGRPGECPMTRTIGPGLVRTMPHRVNDVYMPWPARRFVARFDRGKMPALRTARPLSPSIDHLDFPVEDERVAA